MITLHIPMSSGIPEGHFVRIRVCPLRVPTEGEEITISALEKEFTLKIKRVNHLVEPDNASALVKTDTLLCSDVPAVIRDLCERYEVTAHE
jgi:hypothetical protein